MENKNKSITMPLNEMIDRLSEWFLSIASIVFLKNEETNEKIYTVLDNHSKEVIFEHDFIGADIEDETKVLVCATEINTDEDIEYYLSKV